MKIPIFLSFLFIIANAGKRFDKSLIISMPVYIKSTLWGAATLKHPNLRIFKGFFNINLRIFVYFMEINLRIFNIIRIFALRKYQIVSNFYIKNKEKNI